LKPFFALSGDKINGSQLLRLFTSLLLLLLLLLLAMQEKPTPLMV